jgi:glycosyltransferase involved in cell wall biosynthesis
MDYKAAQKVDAFIGNSNTVSDRIKRYYNREATTIYPGVEVDRYKVSTKPGKHYLIVGRQVAYKRLDLAVEAFNELGLPLVVVGEGEEITVQKPRSKSNIKYVGRVPDAEKVKLYEEATAFIFPGEEDFGIVNVEAQAAGRPVIAYGKGGATETVVEGVTGTFFSHQTPESLAEAVKRFEGMKFDPHTIRKHAENFSVDIFKKRLGEFVEAEYAKLKEQ